MFYSFYEIHKNIKKIFMLFAKKLLTLKNSQIVIKKLLFHNFEYFDQFKDLSIL